MEEKTKASSEIPVTKPVEAHEEEKKKKKEMEGELASLKEQLKGLSEKIAENRKVEADVSAAIQQELAASRSQVVNLEQRLSSTEALFHELTHELILKKDSEDIDNDLDDIKGDLQSKDDELKFMKLELEDEVRARELVEADLKFDKLVVSTLQDDSAYLRKETEYLTSKVELMEEMSIANEKILKVLEENLYKTDPLLSETMYKNAELRQKLKIMKRRHRESAAAAATATQRNLELEDIIRASNDQIQDYQQVVEAGPSSGQALASSSEILHSQQGADVSSAMIGFGAAVALVSVIIAIILAKPYYY